MSETHFKKLKIRISAGDYSWIYINPEQTPCITVKKVGTLYYVSLPQTTGDIFLAGLANEHDAVELADRMTGFFVDNEDEMVIEQSGQEDDTVTEILEPKVK